MKNNPRAVAAFELAKVIAQGQSFNGDFPTDLLSDPRDQSFAREICYGTLRHYPLLKALVDPLLKKPLAKKDSDVYALLLSAVYQLRFMGKPDHAVINSAVEATQTLKKKWAKGLVNAVLRNWLRLKTTDDSLEEAARQSHPEWLYQKICKEWPNHFNQILAYNNTPPPMTLRLAPNQMMKAYCNELADKELNGSTNEKLPFALTLDKAVAVDILPGFSNGLVSVQDAGAQYAASLLDLESNNHVLDACAAPGGKSIHALQLQPDISLVALDLKKNRIQKLNTDLHRCNVREQTTTLCYDANNTEAWWDKKPFDRILLDAPCSGSGIISHHPDIKLLRRANDLHKFATQQIKLLTNLWPLLKPGGKLLYCTCSIMPDENDRVIEMFLADQQDAQLENIHDDSFIKTDYGYQLLPNERENGGFFYARIVKRTKL